MKCPACATPVPDGARFCPACGHLLHARADERRIVTVVFADLVGFTTFSEGRDPEQVKNLVDRCFERLVADIVAFGGRVDKIVGDAIIALFGAPVAHEDDAERAVRAALQMQRTLAGVTGQLDAQVRLRIGVNTGEVLVGALRAGGDYTAMGDVVNVASRLQTLAVPGQIVVGPATHAATRDVVQYEFVGDVQARGREEPVPAWRAVAALAPPGYRPRRAPTPLVGRDEELGVLRHALAAAAGRRRAQLVLLIGEAGIGKSRLAEEMARVAREENGALVLEGRCVPYGEANVWWPVAEAVRQACGIEPSDPADVSAEKSRRAVERATGLPPGSEDADRLADGLRYLMGDEDALPDVDPARAADDARRSLLSMLEAMAAQQPIVLVLSELHWADKLVLDLVDQVLDRLRHLPVVLVATARPELEDRWAPKPSRHNLIALHLDPLDEQSGRDLLTALLGEEPPRELRDALLERSGGNPFFLEELVALLSEAGVLRPEGVYLADDKVATHELPATLRGLVAARLDALPFDERSVLEDAAVLGHTGHTAALSAQAEARGIDLDAALQELAAKDLLVVADGEFEFRSELVREVAYETLTKAERARRHAALASWLAANARATGREDEYLEQLAHHFGEAAELEKELGGVEGLSPDICDTALQAIERAAVRAKQRDMHAVSIPLLDRALRLLPPGPGRPMRRVLLERARARTHLHDLAGARDDLAEVFRQIEGGHHPVSRARALTVKGHILQTEGDLAGSAAALDEAIAGWRSLGDQRGEAEALSMRGMTSLFAGRPDDAEASIRQALEVFRSLGSSRDEAWALWNLAWLSFEEGRMIEAEQRLEKAARAFTEARDWGGLAWAHGLLGFVKYFQGERREAEEIANRVLVGIEDRGDRWAHGMVLVLLAGVRLWDGRTAEAMEPAAEAVRLFTGIADIRGQGLAYATLARAMVASGRVREGLAVLDEADTRLANDITLNNGFARAGVANHIGDPATALAQLAAWKSGDVVAGDMATTEGSAMHALALLQSGDVAGAVAAVEHAVATAPAPGSAAAGNALLALALAAARRPDEALAAADVALGIEVRTYLDNLLALVARGCALAQAGDEAGAREAFARAEAVVDATGDRVHQATARLAKGRALEALGADDAFEALEAARERLAQLDVAASGWDTAFRLAAGAMAPHA